MMSGFVRTEIKQFMDCFLPVPVTGQLTGDCWGAEHVLPRDQDNGLEDKVLEDEFIIGMITNTISIGGFKGLVGLDVALDDGEFEVLLVRKPRTPKDIASIASYLILREGENDCVYQFRAKTLRVISQEPVDWSLDGEYGGSRTEILIENKSRAVSIRRRASSVVEAL